MPPPYPIKTGYYISTKEGTMEVQAINPINPVVSRVEEGKEKVERGQPSSQIVPKEVSPEEKNVHSEELLDQIKELTKDGMYQVRFEMNNNVDKLVISLLDGESGEVVRQIPSEELLNMMEHLRDLTGNLVNSEG